MTTEIIAQQINLRTAQNCASCHHMGGWADNAFCRKYQIEVSAKQVCDGYQPDQAEKE